jgi:hypothetical protein
MIMMSSWHHHRVPVNRYLLSREDEKALSTLRAMQASLDCRPTAVTFNHLFSFLRKPELVAAAKAAMEVRHRSRCQRRVCRRGLCLSCC